MYRNVFVEYLLIMNSTKFGISMPFLVRARIQEALAGQVLIHLCFLFIITSSFTGELG